MADENEDGDKTVLFGKYEMGTLLGQGTFAKVYRGTSLVGGETVAIKVYKKEGFRRDATLTDLIKREISIMRLVRHPNVVELKEVMANRKKIFFVMEYVRGGDLFSQIAKGRVKEDLARKYFQQLICAIDFCHSRDIAHRDLKPENILLDENGNIKISDFGLSALPEHKWSDGLLHTECGTPAYVAPEVMRKKGYDGFKSDIWSAGVVLFVLLAGYLPFHDPNLNRMYRKAFKAEFRVPNWVSLSAKGLISRLLVVDPAKRATIPEIMRHPWFLKDYARPLASSHQENGGEGLIGDAAMKPQPPFYNAFELITSMASGFDLSGLFESERRAGSVFTAKCSASRVVERLRSLATEANFSFTMEKGFKVRMRGKGKGRGGTIMVAVKVFEVAPEVAVVELFKCAGDTLEYAKFCEEVARPALNDIVWCWQGEY